MKKVLSVLVAAIMLAALCVPAFAAGEKVTLNAPKEALVGDTVKVTVDVTQLSGLKATINFDTKAFDYVSAVSGTAMLTEINENAAKNGAITIASAQTKVVDGTVVEITLKYKGGNGVVSIDIQDAVDANDKSLPLKADSVTVAQGVTPTTPTPEESTTPPKADNNKNDKKPADVQKPAKENPKEGGTVSVAASAAAVVVMAAAVAYTMKKKNED